MGLTASTKKTIKRVLNTIPLTRNCLHGVELYQRYNRGTETQSMGYFLFKNGRKFYMCSLKGSKVQQISRLLDRLDICPVENKTFFYSLDCYKALSNRNRVYGNNSVDNNVLVNSSFRSILETLKRNDSEFEREERLLVESISAYLDRCKKVIGNTKNGQKQINAIQSVFTRPAISFFEGLQRILFYNQLLWQTGHRLNGLGHLDYILFDLYQKDITEGALTQNEAKEMLKDFFRVLHENYWYKSNMLLGDTGQIIILGGRKIEGGYCCNDLTYLLVEVAKELRFPDPKILLRCAEDMPEDLLTAAVGCIATGIGAPLLSNDEIVIPALISCGYDEEDAYNYGTSACWEPLVPGVSCEANNIASINFAIPFVEMLETQRFDGVNSLQSILELYNSFLTEYIRKLLEHLTELLFEEDPLLSLVSPSSKNRGKDITRGGAKYNGLGLTSVGLGTVVNSLLNIRRLVFEEKRYSLEQLNDLREKNFADGQFLQELKDLAPCFGCDDTYVIDLTKQIIAVTSSELNKYMTKLGGRFKFGLSSPNYISDAQNIPATFDGRRNGDPFSVHISSGVAVPATELLSFAMHLDYNENRLNGNVIDFINSPGMMIRNIAKYVKLLRAGFAGGIFQLQMNVVDSKTLIAAKNDPTLFPNLIVRVWGFSAYFNDLPEEYKDVLISRALESEKAA